VNRERVTWRIAAAALLLGAAASLDAVPIARAKSGATAGGSIVRVDIPAPSLHLARRDVLVYLPPSYAPAASANRRYPVLFLLHGEPGSNADWRDRARIGELLDRLIARRAIPEVIALMPDADGPGPGGRSLYLNSWDGRLRMEDFIVRDLVEWADAHLRTRRAASQRALVGVSDGANAAINLAFKHPEEFRACAGLSGEYLWSKEPRVPPMLGPEPGASRLLAENSPVRYVDGVAPRLRGLGIYFDSGLLDFAFLDDRALDRKLTALGVPHVYREYWGWHDWLFWRRRLAIALPWVTRGMW
jgi:enterochelin esterase-like enzyme